MHPERLLLLEDDSSLREVLHDALSEEGWDVVLCSTYDDLLGKAQSGQARIAVSDCWGASQSVLNSEERAQILALSGCVPLVLLTGRSWALNSRGAELGLAGVVAKPFDLDKLMDTIAAIRQ